MFVLDRLYLERETIPILNDVTDYRQLVLEY